MASPLPQGEGSESDQQEAARKAREREVERALVQRAIQRDAVAFAELYDRHVVRVYRHIYYMINDNKETEDLTAHTFLKAWEAVERYKERGAPFIAWLLRIAHNLTVSHLRARRDHSELHDTHEDQNARNNPEHVLVQSAEEQNVRDAVLRLREEQRQVIMLRFVEEMDYREVAAVIGKSVPAVRVIQHRALGNLRKLIEDKEQVTGIESR